MNKPTTIYPCPKCGHCYDEAAALTQYERTGSLKCGNPHCDWCPTKDELVILSDDYTPEKEDDSV